MGVAPESDIYVIKALGNSGKGKWANIIEGVQWAIDHKIDVLNMSLGSDEYSKGLEEVLKKAYNSGMFIVAPAGNNGQSTRLFTS